MRKLTITYGNNTNFSFGSGRLRREKCKTDASPKAAAEGTKAPAEAQLQRQPCQSEENNCWHRHTIPECSFSR